MGTNGAADSPHGFRRDADRSLALRHFQRVSVTLETLLADDLTFDDGGRRRLADNLRTLAYRLLWQQVSDPQAHFDCRQVDSLPGSDIARRHAYLDLLASVAGKRLSACSVCFSLDVGHETSYACRAQHAARNGSCCHMALLHLASPDRILYPMLEGDVSTVQPAQIDETSDASAHPVVVHSRSQCHLFRCEHSLYRKTTVIASRRTHPVFETADHRSA